jgi:hypothetical protein
VGVFGQRREDDVVDDRPILPEKMGVCATSRASGNAIGREMLDILPDALTLHDEFAHMGDVEQPRAPSNS